MTSDRRKKQPAAKNTKTMISFRATLADKLLIEQNAKAHGCTVSEWVYAAALRRQPSARTTIPLQNRGLWLALAGLSDALDERLWGAAADETTIEIARVKSVFDEVVGALLGVNDDAD